MTSSESNITNTKAENNCTEDSCLTTDFGSISSHVWLSDTKTPSPIVNNIAYSKLALKIRTPTTSPNSMAFFGRPQVNLTGVIIQRSQQSPQQQAQTQQQQQQQSRRQQQQQESQPFESNIVKFEYENSSSPTNGDTIVEEDSNYLEESCTDQKIVIDENNVQEDDIIFIPDETIGQEEELVNVYCVNEEEEVEEEYEPFNRAEIITMQKYNVADLQENSELQLSTDSAKLMESLAMKYKNISPQLCPKPFYSDSGVDKQEEEAEECKLAEAIKTPTNSANHLADEEAAAAAAAAAANLLDEKEKNVNIRDDLECICEISRSEHDDKVETKSEAEQLEKEIFDELLPDDDDDVKFLTKDTENEQNPEWAQQVETEDEMCGFQLASPGFLAAETVYSTINGDMDEKSGHSSTSEKYQKLSEQIIEMEVKHEVEKHYCEESLIMQDLQESKFLPSLTKRESAQSVPERKRMQTTPPCAARSTRQSSPAVLSSPTLLLEQTPISLQEQQPMLETSPTWLNQTNKNLDEILKIFKEEDKKCREQQFLQSSGCKFKTPTWNTERSEVFLKDYFPN